jgi:hypothetical protein
VKIACIVGSFAAIWALVLLWFRLRGKVYGCAAGHAFEIHRSEESVEETEQHQESIDTDDNLSQSESRAEVTGNIPCERSDEFCRDPPCNPELQYGREPMASNRGASSPENIVLPFKQESSHHSIHSNDNSSVHTDDSESAESVLPLVNSRGIRTRIAFSLCGFVSIICLPLILTMAFNPVQDTVSSSQSLIVEANQVVNEINISLRTINSAVDASFNIFKNTPLNLTVLCPDVPSSDIETVLGVSLVDLVDTIRNDYASIEIDVTAVLDKVESVIVSVQDGINFVDTTFESTKDYLWVVPGFLLMLGATTCFILWAVYLAWKQESSRRFQCYMSYGAFPFLVLLSCVCWALTITTAITTAMGSDACLFGRTSSTPDSTIAELMNVLELPVNGTVRGFIELYTTNACRTEKTDPLQTLFQLEAEVDGIAALIYDSLAKVDEIGRNEILESCKGNAEDFTFFLSQSGSLARLLTSLGRALDSVAASLDCDRIHELYMESIHISLCTQIVGASSWGFVLFLLLSLSTMTMITLRAAWLHTVTQEKIYDESEVADNMILDEHEEYLEYISKYKHEWQEYKGIDKSIRQHQLEKLHKQRICRHLHSCESEDFTGSGTPSYSVDDEMSETSDTDLALNNRDCDTEISATAHEPFDPYYQSDVSIASETMDNMSFFSFREDADRNANDLMGSSTILTRSSLSAEHANNNGGERPSECIAELHDSIEIISQNQSRKARNSSGFRLPGQYST